MARARTDWSGRSARARGSQMINKTKDFDTPSNSLIEEYVTLCVGEDEAIEAFDNRKFKRLFNRRMVIVDELKARLGDDRKLLIPHLQHANRQVRLNAAHDLIVVAPDQARSTLEAIAASKYYPHAADAGMALRMLDNGTFVPT